jgi:hypothetical protein
MSYISDRNFLDEFFEKENRTGKQQETLVYLKKQEQEQALTFLASARLENFYSRTEYYPQVGYNVIGHSLWDDHLTYFQDSELSVANYRPDDRFRTLRHSGGTLVADTLHELDLPLKLGPVNVVPFAEGRLSYFGEQLDFSGPTERFSAREGARAATQAWRVYNDVESDFWDVHGLRHVQIFDVSASAAQVSTASRKLIPFQVTEYGTPSVVGVDSTGLFDFGWRNRFQTMRGGPHEKPQSIDWLTVDLEAFFYSNRQFPSLSPDQRREYNHLRLYTQWRTTDSVSLWSETNYNTDRGTLGKFTVGAVVTHTPRLSYLVGHYLIPDGHSAQTFVGFDYQINEKWRLNVLEAYDFDQKQNAQSDFVLTRRLHRWLVRIRVRLDQGQDEQFFGLEFQPLGVKDVRFSW